MSVPVRGDGVTVLDVRQLGRFQPHVIELQGLIVIVGEQDSLAPDLIVGRQLSAQRGVVHVPRQVVERAVMQQIYFRVLPFARLDVLLGLREQFVAQCGDGRWVGGEVPHFVVGVEPVTARQDVGG